MEKDNIKIDLQHVLDLCKNYASKVDANTEVGKAMKEAYMDIYCSLVSTYIYKGW